MKYYYIATSLVVFIPSFLGILIWEKLTKPLKLIFFLILTSCIFNLIMIYFGLKYRNNVWIGHIYTIIEFFLISSFFYLIFKSRLLKKIVLLLMIIFAPVVVLNKIFLESFHAIDNYSLTLSSIILLAISSMYFVEYITNNMIVNFKDYRFLLSIGFMIYFGGNLFIFALSNEVKGIWLVHNIIYIILILIISIVFLWQR